MRIAIIAAGADLAQIPAEAQQLTNIWSSAGAEVVLLAGPQATRTALQQATRPPLDRFWIAAHMGDQGIALADGVLTIPELAQWIAMSHAEAGVLNGCNSAVHVATIQRFADVDLAAAIQEDLDDERAAITAGYLAQAWSETGDLEQAARLATANGAIEYRFYPAARRPAAMQQNDPDHSELVAKVEKLIFALQGDPRWGHTGLIPMIEDLRADFHESKRAEAEYRKQDHVWKTSMEAEIAGLKHRAPYSNTALIVIVVGLPIVFMLFLIWQQNSTLGG